MSAVDAQQKIITDKDLAHRRFIRQITVPVFIFALALIMFARNVKLERDNIMRGMMGLV